MKPTHSKPLMLLKDMQDADCSMLQLTLHLGVHPEDRAALNQYNELVHAKQNARSKADSATLSLRSYHTSPACKQWDWHQAN